MRRFALWGTLIGIGMLAFGLMMVPMARANGVEAPAMQGTATATADAGTATASPEATTAATGTADAAITATTATADTGTQATGTAEGLTAAATGTAETPGALPNTGANGGQSMTILAVALALLILGCAAVIAVVASRREVQA